MHSANKDPSDAPVADYRQRYGLTEDPFRDDPDFAFFGGGGRRALLEQLEHLCQFSASFLAVLGKQGVGKSRVALELANTFRDDDEICLLSARAGAHAEDVLSQMASHFALPLDTDNPSIGRLLAALRHFAQVADDEDRLALTIIDDAHHLDEKTLGALISLLQGQDSTGRRLHIVLFAEPEMLTRLDQFNMHDVLIHDFELSPLALEEAADYLNFRMEMSGYMGPEVFTEKKVEPWWRQAEGRLPQLHERARRWLLESVTSESAPQSSGRAPLPLVHIVVIAVLLGVLLMVFLYRGEPEEQPDAGTTRLPDTRESQSLTLPRELDRDQSRADGGPSTDGVESPVPGFSREQTQPSALEVSQEEVGPDNQPLAETSISEEPEADAETETSSRAEPETGNREESEPTVGSPDIPEQEQILLSWPSTAYTLQLLGAGSRESVDAYVRSQSNRDELLVFESRRGDKPWFVVVTGRYDSNRTARTAIDKLPDAQREAGPWPRAMEEIQEEIEQFRGVR